MSSILLIIQVLLAVILTIVILLQKSASMGLGAYSGSNESLFGAKGPAGFLAKFTFFVFFLFFINTLALGYTYNQSLRDSVVDSAKFDSIKADQFISSLGKVKDITLDWKKLKQLNTIEESMNIDN